MNSTEARDRAIVWARTDPQAALEMAREVAEPWFRAQALAAVCLTCEAGAFRAVLSEAKAASLACDDPYEVVGSSAWWLSAMVKRDGGKNVPTEVDGLLGRVSRILHPVSRLDALHLLFQAVFETDESRRSVVDALVQASMVAQSWKSGDRLRDAALMLARRFPGEAERVVQVMPEGTHKRSAIRRIAAGERREPRAF